MSNHINRDHRRQVDRDGSRFTELAPPERRPSPAGRYASRVAAKESTKLTSHLILTRSAWFDVTGQAALDSGQNQLTTNQFQRRYIRYGESSL